MRKLALLLLLAPACADPEPALRKQSSAATVCGDGPTVTGIDVSYWQGTIDWEAVAADGIDYAFIRATHGLGTIDTQFDANWAGARANGILRGVYQFFSPDEDPIAQADLMLEMMGPLEADDLPPVIDVEAVDGQAPEEIARKVGLWLEHVQAATGRTPIIYTGKYFWNDNVGSAAFSGYPLWHAQYTSASCPDLANAWSDWTFWQTSSTGSVAGISGNVDTDVFNGDYDQLLALADGTPPPPCGVIAATGGEVDDGDACFTGGGPIDYLRAVEDAGEGGDLLWTHATDDTVEANFAHWKLFLAEAGTYRVEVYTDAAYAQSHQAGYELRHAGEQIDVVVDQTAADGWQSLGDFTFAEGGDQWLHLGDDTGETLAANVQLVFDAVRLTRLDAPVIPGDDDGGDGDGELEGGCSAGGGSAGGLVVLAAFGLLRRRRAR